MALVNVADFIWNDIARTQDLRTPWARRAFSLDGQQMADLEDADYFALKEKFGAAVASGFINVRPLFFENAAIARYVMQHPGFAGALPEITSPEDGAMVAALDNRVIQDVEEEKLAALLAAELEREISEDERGRTMMEEAIDELVQLLGVKKKQAKE